MTENLNNLLTLLLKSDIDFVLVGGMAAVLYGSSQVTQDLDICSPLTPDAVGKLRMLFKDNHPKHRMTPQRLSFLDHPDDVTSIKNLYLQTDLGVIDIISSVTGVGAYHEVKKNAQVVEIFGCRCWIISLEDLIRTKEALGRDKDKVALKELKTIQTKSQ